jgi:hypothetical protein
MCGGCTEKIIGNVRERVERVWLIKELPVCEDVARMITAVYCAIADGDLDKKLQTVVLIR